MRAPRLRTVPDELMPVALSVHEYLSDHGYRVRCEVSDPAAPFTPTFTAIRASTTLLLEVCGTIEINRVREWVAYGKSTGSDTRVALCMPDQSALSTQQDSELRQRGVGLFLCGSSGIREVISGVDLAFNLELPPIAPLPRRGKELLGPAYEKFKKGEWREGFEEACNAFEEEARRYLSVGQLPGKSR